MGGSTSRLSRKLPARPPPSWAGARTDRPQLNITHRPPPSPSYQAEDHKTQSILDDAKDPHLVKSLYSLGQANAPRMTTTKEINPTSQMFESRKISEDQALSFRPIPNRMTASLLSELLDARKSVRSREELEVLARQYSIEVAVLEGLARSINTPSIGEQFTSRSVEDGEERVTSKVYLSLQFSQGTTDKLLTLQALWKNASICS
ncbi:hypothetical protein BS47DRAFT_1287787 [Hydnum rufescens UP504]|uniref:Uncharacterized protein n=1 Tax=Hydnum rufescens UP504 TaxID=1448309 RepID=A0A9P6BBS8_9AGAM|nr:hypothetical protein BS47DRAFT_1287787 [Hydnum rufescens UP504]